LKQKINDYEVDIMTGSPIRFTGLVSGMDTQQMVNQLMRAEGLRMDRLNRRRQHLVWRQEALRGTMTHLNEWRTANTQLGSPMIPLGETTWDAVKTTIERIGGGSTAGFGVRADNTAALGTTNVSVHQIAQRDLARGSGQWLGTGHPSSAPYMPLNTATTRIYDFMGGTAGGAFASFTQDGDITIDGNTIPVYRGSITINGRNVAINSHDTIDQFMNRVNNTAGINARMSFNTLSGNFELESTEMGRNALVRTGDGTRQPGYVTGVGNGLDDFGFLTHIGLNHLRTIDTTQPSAHPGYVDTTRFAAGNRAQDALLYIDGVSVTRNTNNFTIEGLTFNLTNALIASPGTPANFTITNERNIEDTMQTIRDFVRAYNELIRHLNNLHTTPRPRHGNRLFFEPLTDEQREAMSDREIERWEEQARTGLVHRDSTLRSIHADMRRWMTEPVRLPDGSTISLHEIGITTGYGTGSERLIGMLQIDETRLTQFLENDPERVRLLFQQNSTLPSTTNAERNSRMGQVGIAHRLNHLIENATGLDGSLRGRVGLEGGSDDGLNPMSQHIRQYDQRIAQMQTWLQRRENHFFAMFARMEQAMAQSHAQLDALFSFAGM
jgi:flagellar hook-associated protein 2